MTPTIAGTGMTAFGRSSASLSELATAAAREALTASNATIKDVDGLILGSFAAAELGRQGFAAAVVSSRLGLTRGSSLTVEAACASGSVALRQAMNAIEAGRAECLLVVGAEKMTGSTTTTVTASLARANDTGSAAYRAGLTFPGFFGLLANAYLEAFDVEADALADVSVKNRRNGAGNPRAQFRSAVSREEVLGSRPIAEPLRLLDCSAISDGAAAIVVAGEDWARNHVDVPVTVIACEQAGGAAAADEVESLWSIPAASAAADRAYTYAGVGPADVDVAEVHDCFTIAEWIALEDLGFVERGGAAAATSHGETAIEGRLPVNPSGGLLAKGHPVGATGVAQLVEISEQLRGKAANQVDRAEVGLTHNVGGTGGVASVTILGRAR